MTGRQGTSKGLKSDNDMLRRFGAAQGVLRGTWNVVVAWVVTPSVGAALWALIMRQRDAGISFLEEAVAWYGILIYDATNFVALAAGLAVAVLTWLTKSGPPRRRTLIVVVGGASAAWFLYHWAVWWGFPEGVYRDTSGAQRAIAIVLGAGATLFLNGYLFQIGAWSAIRSRGRSARGAADLPDLDQQIPDTNAHLTE